MINNKRIVLTGANSGIGLEVLKLLAEGDNKILAVDLHTDKLETFDNSKVIPMVMDVSKKENVDLIFERAIEVLGGIDIFYANAGYPYYELFDYTNWERVEKMFETNVFPPSILTQNTWNILTADKDNLPSQCLQSAQWQSPATPFIAHQNLP